MGRRIALLELRPSKPGEIPAQKALWKKAFGDEESYIDTFYNRCAAPEDVLILLEDGVLRSMLALLPLSLALPAGSTATSAYLYALCSDPEYRKQGFGRYLLQYVDFYLGERGIESVITVPAEPSLHRFFATMDFAECFATRKIELLAADVGPAAQGDSVSPVDPISYGALREQLLAGSFHAVYSPCLLAYQEEVCHMAEGALLRLNVGGSEGCAAVEMSAKGNVIVKELLLPADQIPAGLAAIAAAFPAPHYHLRTPALWGGHRVSYVQPFAMIKWLNGAQRRLWGQERNAYFGLAFD